MTDQPRCQHCRWWTRHSAVYGECSVAPKAVQTLESYRCREWEARSGRRDDWTAMSLVNATHGGKTDD